jgi:hypothetical protein
MSTNSNTLGCDAGARPSWRRYVATTLLNAGALALVVLAFDAVAPRWSAFYGPGEARVRLGWVLATAAGVTGWNTWLQRLCERASRARRG